MTKEQVKQILDTCEPSLAKKIGKYTYSGMHDTPYKEVKAPFNWYKALTKEKITDKQWQDMKERASAWVTCACGNQCEIIPRQYSNAPVDLKLNILGYQFNDAIQERNRGWALQVLDEIEERSAELIAQIKGININ